MIPKLLKFPNAQNQSSNNQVLGIKSKCESQQFASKLFQSANLEETAAIKAAKASTSSYKKEKDEKRGPTRINP